MKESIKYLSESYNVNDFSQNPFEITGGIVKDFIRSTKNVEDIEELDLLALRNKFLEEFEGIKNED